jgi:hypothetical protein
MRLVFADLTTGWPKARVGLLEVLYVTSSLGDGQAFTWVSHVWHGPVPM